MSSVQCIPGLCVQLSLQPMVHACTEHVQALSQNMQEQHDAAATPPLSFHHIAARMHVLGFQPPPAALSKGGVWLLCCLGCILHCTTPDQCTYHTPQQLYFRLSVQVHRQLSWVTEVHGSPSSRQQHPPPRHTCASRQMPDATADANMLQYRGPGLKQPKAVFLLYSCTCSPHTASLLIPCCCGAVLCDLQASPAPRAPDGRACAELATYQSKRVKRRLCHPCGSTTPLLCEVDRAI